MGAEALLLAALVTASEVAGGATLPEFGYALECHFAGQRYIEDLREFRRITRGWRSDELGVAVCAAIDETGPLSKWWGHVADARNPGYGWRVRLRNLREAREMHDWRLYGLPPCLPYWRLEWR